MTPGPGRPPALRLCVALVRLASRIVPRDERSAWVMEWEAELHHRWSRRLSRRAEAALVRRSFGALADATWLRRQFTLDAEVVHDTAHGIRVLAKSPGFTAVALLVLAAGLGAATTIGSVADALLLRPLPIRDADAVVTLWERNRTTGAGGADVAPGNAIDWVARPASFAAAAAVEPWSLDFTPPGGEPEVLYAARVTQGFFDTLGMPLLAGRAFLSSEFVKGNDRVVVLSHRLWRERFGADPTAIGRVIQLDHAGYTVVGILPPLELRLFEARREPSLFLPKYFDDYERGIRGSGYWNVIGRLKSGVSIAQARSEMATLSAQLARDHPQTNRNIEAEVVPLRAHLAGSLRPLLPLLFGAASLLLLSACGNVANLLLARGTARLREFAVRRALGAGRGRLVRQMLSESLLLAAAGGALGLLLARISLRAIAALHPTDVAGIDRIPLDGRVAAIGCGLAVLAALLAGIAPAWHLSRPAATAALREGGNSAAPRRLRHALVVIEVALALLLAVGAGLLVRSLRQIERVNPGFARAEIAALQVFAWDRNETPQKRSEFFRRTLEAIGTVPGVAAAGAVSAMPFIEANINIRSTIAIDGRPPAAPGAEPLISITIVAGDYFRAMGIPLERGRVFTRRDDASAARAVVISRSAARAFWPGVDPIGSNVTIRFQGRPIHAEVVGIVGDARHDGLDRPARPELFLAHPQQPFGSMTYVVRTQPGASVPLNALKQQIWSIDPQQAFYRTATVEELVARTLVGRRFVVFLLSGFGAVACLLAMAGLYGVMSFATSQRAREFGVRLALGARPFDILSMVLREGLGLACTGAVVGIAAAAATTRLLAALLFGVTPLDPLTFASVAGAILIVSGVSCYLPARRATRVQPSDALRAS